MENASHEELGTLLRQAQTRAERLREIGRLSLDALRAQDPERVMQEAAEAARRLLKADRASVRIWDEQRELLVCRCMIGYGPNIVPAMLDRRPGEGVVGIAFKERRPSARVGYADIAHPVHHPEYIGLNSAVAAPLLSSSGVLGVLTAGSLQARSFDEKEDGDLLQQLANLISTALEKARLVAAEVEKSARLQTLYETGRLVSSTLEIDKVLAAIVGAATRISGATFGILCLRDEHDPDVIFVAANQGLRSGILQGARMPVGEGLIGLCIHGGEALLIPDIRDDPRSRHREIDEAEDFRALLYAPIRSQGQVIGGLVVGRTEPGGFTREHLDVLLALADQAATSIVNARLYQRSKDMGIAEERNRFAREIHDTLAQGLTGITLQLEVADMQLGDHPARTRVVRALELARQNLQEARRSVLELRGDELGGLPLGEALAHLANDLSADHQLLVRCRVPADLPRFSARVETGLYRIAQEALANVRHHASARHLDVELSVCGSDVCLVIDDDGRGFDPAAVRPADESGGFGLRGMRERATILGGRTEITSAPGVGTRLVVTVPQSGLARPATG